ncbi:hypothetical protein PV327_008604 [Microctonus hyperodae]|uniref:CCDC66 domain-containing protein n=1 Tax=Microctonus hyperodae TaxID=165561 RepID=A0AA39KHT3_MICHY|nr:hypothetical protein PV327_008604 [Microctonus hyperodae]
MMERISLVEQKRLQWAKEREEMARLNGHWEITKTPPIVHSTIRTKISTREQTTNRKPLRVCGHYGSATSLKSLDTNISTSFQSINLTSPNTNSLININDRQELPELIRKRSPSLPPIHTKEHQQIHHQTNSTQELPSLEVEGSRYTNHPRVQKHSQRGTERRVLTGNTYEEREGETSGYASDSIEAIVAPNDIKKLQLSPLEKIRDSEMSERTWQNPYCDTPDTCLPSSHRVSITRLGELNRPRWESIWGTENANNDPPPLSWLERGLSRLDHSSQVLVINHDSASSPDSSTTSSTNSDSKTYLRGQNIPVDAQILIERETRRQKALELQNAIKQQLLEKDKKRKEEREQKIREELEEEERIKRERDAEKQRFEEEQRRLREKEEAKLKKEEAMREILETAERIAKEKKRQRRQRDDYNDENIIKGTEINNEIVINNNNCSVETNELNNDDNKNAQIKTDNKTIIAEQLCQVNNAIENNEINLSNNNGEDNSNELPESLKVKDNLIRLPLNKEVAIVLTGKIEDTNFLDGNNLQLLNLVMNQSQKYEHNSNVINANNINALIKNFSNLELDKNISGTSSSPAIIENRLLTPSKYRTPSGRDFGTQTDGETDCHDLESKEITKERKEGLNINNNTSRDLGKSINVSTDEKNVSRSKSQPRQSLETRPRWNANRPGTRYRTQSEKDPHYQKRLRLRRRRVESSDERSRSPSPDQRMSNAAKAKIRNALHRKSKLDSYDADTSMDSLNSVVPLRIDEHGRINVRMNGSIINNRHTNDNSSNSNDESVMTESRENINSWDGQNIISQLVTLKNGLLSKQREWDSSRCLVSPRAEFY